MFCKFSLSIFRLFKQYDETKNQSTMQICDIQIKKQKNNDMKNKRKITKQIDKILFVTYE